MRSDVVGWGLRKSFAHRCQLIPKVGLCSRSRLGFDTIMSY
jgi:hypothetical protein